MCLVGKGASAARHAAALNQCLLPAALESCFDVADISVLINVKMDSTVQDHKEESTCTGGRKTRMERKSNFQMDLFFFFFFSDLTMDFTGIKADTHLQ